MPVRLDISTTKTLSTVRIVTAAGTRLRSRPVRFASAAVTILTVLKVFVVDMSNLTGIYQALSFIGLGIVLLGIARFYQRLLFAPIAQGEAATSDPARS